jgi:hypothetical protein
MPFGYLGRSCRIAALFAYAISGLQAQCLVPFPGGSKVNPNRPRDGETPVARFSPLGTVNRQLPQWICFTAGYRTRFEGYSGANFLANASDSYLLTRFRLGALIRPSAWFRVYAELQDTDAFLKSPPLVPPYQETWDLRRAYVDFGDIEAGPVALRVGRLDLNFGDGLLIGTSYWRNASRGYAGGGKRELDQGHRIRRIGGGYTRERAESSSAWKQHLRLGCQATDGRAKGRARAFLVLARGAAAQHRRGDGGQTGPGNGWSPAVGPHWAFNGLRDRGGSPIWKAGYRQHPRLGMDGQRRVYFNIFWA